MRGKRLDAEAIARACVESHQLGTEAAAAKHGISIRSIKRYRAQMRPLAPVGTENRSMRRRFDDFLKAAVEVLQEKLETADAYQTAGAIKIVGDLRIAEVALEARGMVNDGQSAGSDSANRPITIEAGQVGAAEPEPDARH